ncbi:MULTISPECIES: phosphoribosyltransferase [unclassified Leptolyngbya]|uniref:phosphoribosyltransferase n=1 Tax=unclassified Leptolyngbya TaxID=2650499 RepID=UPI00168786F8|nr:MULTISPECIES: phosphoribosyltransferase [unclassified Leptolyngbya]MBD1913724.1 phosphoribosyltransferase [Leptolyngbya sp. FACHB-8]MBD2155687.1 phosphoribosyltransferase [Leptolyngbya sp. FACHB-16]
MSRPRHHSTLLFRDRQDAGIKLAQKLQAYTHQPGALVLGLPRGGIPVAYEVAKALRLPLDVYVVRKLGVPGQEELAMGAIALGGITYFNEALVEQLEISQDAIAQVIAQERQELQRREQVYRGNRPPLELRDRTILLVDDGLATGATMRAAIRSLRLQMPHQIVMAVPVADPGTCASFQGEADQVCCAETPQPFRAVGLWYENFGQTTDQEVCNLLHQAGL